MSNQAVQMLSRERDALGAMSAAMAIIQMDPHFRDDLIVYLREFNKTKAQLTRAESENDSEEMGWLNEELMHITKAIVELFESDDLDAIRNASTLDGFEAKIRAMPGGERQYERTQGWLSAFQQRYRDAKTKSGLETIAQVAEKAGLSKTTVHAIESGRGRPHFKTIKKLAIAFGVTANSLVGD